MPRWISRRTLVIGILTSLAVCTGSGPLGADSQAPTPDNREDVRLGIVVPLTGPLASLGVEVRNGVLLAVQGVRDNNALMSGKL